MKLALSHLAALALLLASPNAVIAICLPLDPPGSIESRASSVSGNTVVGTYSDGSRAYGFLPP